MNLYDLVALREDNCGLVAGAIGTIVHEHIKGKMFIVEFCDEQGRTLALVDLSRGDLKLATEFRD